MARVAFLFPGQGAQTVGMGASLSQALPAARHLFDQAADLLGYDLLAVCASGPKEKLDSTAVSQPAIYVASLAALEHLKQTEPAAVAECVAAACIASPRFLTRRRPSAKLSAPANVNAVYSPRLRQAAADARAGTMVSVLLLEQPRVEEIVAAASSKGLVRIANFLCPGNVVVSGEVGACEEVERLAGEAGARTIRLAVAGAFHTPLMQSAVDALTAALADVPLSPLRLPVWANVTASVYGGPGGIKEMLARQVVEPVRWEQTMRGLLEQGVERFYEIGPGKVLAGLLKRIVRKIDCRNVSA